jgi:putative Holliday junction resolvase
MPDTPDLAEPRTILAFDFGLRRIGTAVGQDITGSASPLGVVNNRETGVDFEGVAALIEEWRPTLLVVGMPAHADGSPSDIQAHVDAFISDLERFGLPIDTVDERHTSVEAERVLKNARAAGTRGRISKAMIDSAAAVFIAERYLASE